MGEHLCTFKVTTEPRLAAFTQFDKNEEECCGKIAHFKVLEDVLVGGGVWLCAKHYDRWLKCDPTEAI